MIIDRKEFFEDPETGEAVPVSVRSRWTQSPDRSWLCVFLETWTDDGKPFYLSAQQDDLAQENAWEEIRSQRSLF